MRQRNPNFQREQNGSQNPFCMSNPYRVKAKFYSEKKPFSESHNITATSSNPQSLRYSRNYKESPVSFQYQQLKNNFISVKNNTVLTKTLNLLQQQLKEQDYQLKLKQFVSDKISPADPYLEIVKDKFLYMSNEPKSQFQNAIKMSNLGISGIVVKKNDTFSQTAVYKDNPFYRKNLISQTTTKTTLPYESSPHYSNLNYNIDSSYVSATYPYNNQGIYNSVSNTSQYQYSAINPIDISIPPLYPRDSIYQDDKSSVSDRILKRIISGLQNRKGYDHSAKQSPKSMSACFGPDYDWKDNTKIISFVNGAIKHSQQHSFNIQSQAPQEIKVKGKNFFLNSVNSINP